MRERVGREGREASMLPPLLQPKFAPTGRRTHIQESRDSDYEFILLPSNRLLYGTKCRGGNTSNVTTGAGNITSHGLREIGKLICVLLPAVGEQNAN